MSDNKIVVESTLKKYKEQILRWNRQINLVSRQHTSARIDLLMKQSRDGVKAVLNYLDANSSREEVLSSRFMYFDLGSGGGFPGVVWHTILGVTLENLSSWLVEPREKRAWFLGRLTALSGLREMLVLRGRWGEVSVDEWETGCTEATSGDSGQEGGDVVLISLKALFLKDEEVLLGLQQAVPGLFCAEAGDRNKVRVVIVRYYPPKQELTTELRSDLCIPVAGAETLVEGAACLAVNSAIVPLGRGSAQHSSLVFSEYSL